jgi:hypothetical protein
MRSEIKRKEEWKEALSSTTPYELNYALPWLLMGQIQKTYRYSTFYPNKKGLFRPKTFSRGCPFNTSTPWEIELTTRSKFNNSFFKTKTKQKKEQRKYELHEV